MNQVRLSKWGFHFLKIVLYYLYGALAQLGARNIRIVEAVGSNPICSMFKRVSQNHQIRCLSDALIIF